MKRNIYLYILIAIIFFCIGYFTSYFINHNNSYITSDTGTYEEGWADARERLLETRPEMAMELNGEKKIITGKINSIKDNNIYITIASFDPLSSRELDERIVNITSNTKIYNYTLVNNTTANIPGGMHDPNEVSGAETIEKIEINKTDLKSGQRITVSSDKDIKNIKQFNASEIIIEL